MVSCNDFTFHIFMKLNITKHLIGNSYFGTSIQFFLVSNTCKNVLKISFCIPVNKITNFNNNKNLIADKYLS